MVIGASKPIRTDFLERQAQNAYNFATLRIAWNTRSSECDRWSRKLTELWATGGQEFSPETVVARALKGKAVEAHIKQVLGTKE